jgi:hypothetical protein
MRTVAQYVFEGVTSSAEQADALYAAANKAVAAWLKGKGATGDGPAELTLSDGRTANYEAIRTSCRSGTVSKWSLEETGQSRFSTYLALARSGPDVAFTCILSTGFNAAAITPSSFTARCPGVIKNLLQLPPGWRVGTTAIPCKALTFSGEAQAPDLVNRLLSPERALPIIVASRYDGFLLHPMLIAQLASDLCGLAIVADLDDKAAWAVTHQLGKEWSCYNGAIRIYWPRLDRMQQPRSHPLWTSERLMYHAADTKFASRRIRDIIRRRLFSVSSFALEQPPLFDRLEDETAKEAIQEKFALAANANDYKTFAEEYAQENEDLRFQLRQERDNIKQLRQDLYQLQLAREWANADEEVAPDELTPPDSVEDAVTQARRSYAQQLTFGDDVERGIPTLAPNAGPPEKILDYLRILASLIDARREGPLGDTMIQWLKNHGAAASNESDTVQNNRGEMQRRTWHDGRGQRKFEMHLKPAEATSPNRCVRIYFDWDDASAKAVVGWVGRHP